MTGANERIVSASLIGADKLKAQFDAAPSKITQELANGLNRIGLLTVNKMRERIAGPLPPKGYPARRTSHMMTGITFDRARSNLPFVTVRSKENYFSMVDKGTKPHGVSKEGQAAIARWAIAHPYMDLKTGKRVSPETSAFLIARAIKRRGTPARHITDSVIPYVKPDVENLFKETLGKVSL